MSTTNSKDPVAELCELITLQTARIKDIENELVNARDQRVQYRLQLRGCLEAQDEPTTNYKSYLLNNPE